MRQQSLLSGTDATPHPTDRLFYAIFPDANTAAQIAQLAQRLRVEHALSGKPLATERFHITLHHLGDYVGLPQDVVTAATRAGEMVTTSSFDVAFDRAMSFSGRPDKRPFVLRGGEGLASLIAFQNTLGQAMQKVGLARWVNPNATPHVTLFYDKSLVAEQAVEEVRWTAHEFILVHSLLGQTRHIPLARWSLRQASQ